VTQAGPGESASELAASLRLARRELKLVRRQQEEDREALQALRRQVHVFSQALAELLGARYRESAPQAPESEGPDASEAALVAEVEASELFDAAWYLRRHPEIAEAGLSPAQHYVRTGAADGHEPGPRFDTARYLTDHPDARDAEVPPLVHHLRAGRR
jgi:hypothetical protein